MSIRTRLVVLVERAVQRGNGALDLIGVHWVRRVKAFPETATLYLLVDLSLDGMDARGVQLITVVAHVPGGREQKFTGRFDFGNPDQRTAANQRTGVQIPIQLNLTFEVRGEWKFEVWHMGVCWGDVRYLVVTEAESQVSGGPAIPAP